MEGTSKPPLPPPPPSPMSPPPPPPLPCAKTRVATKMPVNNSLQNMKSPLLPSPSPAAPPATTRGTVHHLSQQIECLPGLGLLVRLEGRIQLGKGLRLHARHL